MPDERLIYTDTPSFLQGTFHWMQRGYQYAHPPDIDLLSAEALSSPDPWIVVAAVLERVKRGDFGSVPLLRKWAVIYNADPTLVAACVNLIAHAGSSSDLDWLAAEMLDQTGWAQVRLVGAAQ